MNKTYIVITGASSGIGRETAKLFAKHGKNLILTARRSSQLEVLKQELSAQYPGLDIVMIPADLSERAEVLSFYEQTRSYDVEAWINDAGRGYHCPVGEQDLNIVTGMLRLNVEALTLLSSLYVHDYQDREGAQLINLSSIAGYTVFPGVTAYSASKFYVSAFTEGLALELKRNGCKLRAKILAPAAVQTEFGKIENNTDTFDYEKTFPNFHTAEQMAQCLYQLYESDQTVGIVEMEPFTFQLSGAKLPSLSPQG